MPLPSSWQAERGWSGGLEQGWGRWGGGGSCSPGGGAWGEADHSYFWITTQSTQQEAFITSQVVLAL